MAQYVIESPCSHSSPESSVISEGYGRYHFGDAEEHQRGINGSKLMRYPIILWELSGWNSFALPVHFYS